MRLRKGLLVATSVLVAVGVAAPVTDAGAGVRIRQNSPTAAPTGLSNAAAKSGPASDSAGPDSAAAGPDSATAGPDSATAGPASATAPNGPGSAARSGLGSPGQAVAVMSFNVCGGVCRRGEVDRTATFAARTALRHRASVVLLQELCFTQFRKVRSLLAARGFSARFAAQTHSKACALDDRRHGTRFGVAVLVRGPAAGTVVRRLPTRPGFEPRLMLGTTAVVGGRRTFVASVHLSPNRRAGLDLQLQALARDLDRRTGRPMIVGGDFNAMPDHAHMGRFYSAAADGQGRFTELDELRDGLPERGGEPTFDLYGRKIDYVFVSDGWFGRPRATAIATPMSDHRVYLGSVRTLGN